MRFFAANQSIPAPQPTPIYRRPIQVYSSELSENAPNTDSIRISENANRLITYIVFLLILILLGVGYFIYQNEQAKDEISDNQRTQNALNIAQDFAEENTRDRFAQAISEGKAIEGMTPQQVLAAMGTPAEIHNGGQLEDFERKAGIIETWIYYSNGTKVVSFGVNGLVIGSSD